MKPRFLALGLCAIAAALVACGGGGGGTPPVSPSTPPTIGPTITPTSTPTLKPTPTPTPASFGCVGQAPFAASSRTSMSVPRPIASGDNFSYTGFLNETYVQSAPCPQPTATTSAQVSSTVSDTATTASSGGSATASTTTETDAFTTHTSTTATTQILQISGSQLLLYSSTSNDGTGNSIATSYGTPQVVDDLGTGGTWNTDPASTTSEALSDGTKIARTTATNGTYNETETFADGSTATIAVNADGSGVYTIPGVSFAYAAPSSQSITLTITSSTGSKTRTFPAWFTVPSPANYISDSFSDNGPQPIPASCNASAIATSGTQIVETYHVLDPVLGYTETRTTASYDVSGYGPACVTIADTLNSYYDYADDTTRIDYQSTNGLPNSVDRISEVLGMQSAACGSGTAPCTQARRIDTVQPVAASAVRGRIAAIELYRAVQRARRVQQLHQFVVRARDQGVTR